MAGETVRIAGIVRESIVDGPGIRLTVFCQGCPHKCPGCHNPETHDFTAGREISTDSILEEFDKNPILAGITFSGGEPMCQPVPFAALAKAVKERGRTVTIFSGYTLNQLMDRACGKTDNLSLEERRATARLIQLCDILIDGPFIKAQRDLKLRFRGSSNQRVIDMNRTREIGRVTLLED